MESGSLGFNLLPTRFCTLSMGSSCPHFSIYHSLNEIQVIHGAGSDFVVF